MTTVESVQASVTQAARNRLGGRINNQSFAMPLLGDNDGLEGSPQEGAGGAQVGAFASFGSFAAGALGRASPAPRLTILGGFSLGQNGHDNYRVEDFRMFAAALRYTAPLGEHVSVAATVGGWYSRDGETRVTRSYLNGAGAATAQSAYSGHDRYLFARLTLGLRPSARDLIAVSGEAGQQRWQADGFTEELSNANPFPATFSEEHGRMGVARGRLGWTHEWNGRISTSLWGGGAWTFDRRSDLAVGVDGIGLLSPRIGGFHWAEYGARLGYRITDRLGVDLFVNGVKGQGLSNQAHVGLRLNLRL
jgi:hypothetical protein